MSKKRVTVHFTIAADADAEAIVKVAAAAIAVADPMAKVSDIVEVGLEGDTATATPTPPSVPLLAPPIASPMDADLGHSTGSSPIATAIVVDAENRAVFHTLVFAIPSALFVTEAHFLILGSEAYQGNLARALSLATLAAILAAIAAGFAFNRARAISRAVEEALAHPKASGNP